MIACKKHLEQKLKDLINTKVFNFAYDDCTGIVLSFSFGEEEENVDVTMRKLTSQLNIDLYPSEDMDTLPSPASFWTHCTNEDLNEIRKIILDTYKPLRGLQCIALHGDVDKEVNLSDVKLLETSNHYSFEPCDRLDEKEVITLHDERFSHEDISNFYVSYTIDYVTF